MNRVYEQMDICVHNDFCGGCIHQGIPYEQQLENKQNEINKMIESKKLSIEKQDEIQGSPKQYRYRNKMEYTFGDMVKGGPTTLGMHQKGRFMSIVTVDQCQLVHEDFNKILSATLKFAEEKGYDHYHKKTHTGLLRHLIVRLGIRTNELLINIVTSSEEGFDEEAYVKMLEELPLENNIVGVLRTINDNIADAVKCEELRVLKGRDYYMEEIMGLKFKVSAFSFFQTNIDAVEALYQEAIDLIDDFDGKTVFDLFCGTGTITQAVASKAKKAVGVEIVEEAVEAAKENAKLNGLDNCEFIAGDVFKVLDDIEEKPDVIIVDPPRMGIEPKALDKIIKYGVDQIVYVSCNPKTLLENLYYLEYNGYAVKYLKLFDNFPNTKHAEAITLLERVK
ncbi:MAG: 23S rRNA (uracil(1939)-C(5))-methyltransferase RlmD [Eubacterium sp.]|nr:23S rRNA (uracil(1939)-C(5))-methyltransferase RlmD [Eubacterium sp.]